VQFKRHSYAATGMEMLPQARGLSKASFYYYSSKEALVLELTQQYLNSHVFKLSQQDDISISQQFEWMHERTI